MDGAGGGRRERVAVGVAETYINDIFFQLNADMVKNGCVSIFERYIPLASPWTNERKIAPLNTHIGQ